MFSLRHPICRSTLFFVLGIGGLAVLASLASANAYRQVAGRAETVRLQIVPSGAMRRIGFYMPQRVELTDKKPDGLQKAPADLTAPLYGVLTIGPKERPASIIVIIDEPEGKDARLFVDTNGNGDLTDDPSTEWKKNTYPGNGGKQYTTYMGGASVQAPGIGQPVHLGMYRFDKNDPDRAQLKSTLFYFRDYAYDGQMRLGSKSYHVMLSDDLATGDFRGKPDDKRSGVDLLIDVNGNGRFDPRGEMYDATKPFNIKGTTYEIADMDPSGSSFKVVQSSKAVAEILPPPDLSAGHKAIPFSVVTTSGRTIHFPGSYKGKVVLLDFWATWCGPCRGELPYLTKAYTKYHPQGFDVLGISLDQANNGPQLAAFTKENNMPWLQVYDGKFWNAQIAQTYVIQSIPHAFLVDGDTGTILAEGEGIRGENLAPAIQKALAKKKQTH
ncbi:MAG TPA: TlpA disulfide reductase family protein [Chthonomonadaceae bacterium]|nr:TlpA disulfide reductase family protein [Chthonomonadaceae bacterium]